MSEIDRVTGAFTPIGDPTPYGSAMTFHPASGEIFVADPFPGSLGRWNPDTSLVTELGPIAPMHSLAWSTTDSALYGIGDAPGARGETNTLYTIDPATGATINTITLSESHYYAALTAIPAPGVFAVVVVCGSTVATRRRRSTGR
ncbi:MAG: hypothetical protein KDA20_10510 [Phycisphaerales bacterium]|nr:hypothetical protein [Phycisphaerales bacterium]